MEDKIKQRIVELFKPALETIERQSNCEHNWPHKDGSAYYRCTKCGYLADDRDLDKSITIMRMMKQGATPEMIKKFKDYI
jgi:rubrerythrin